MGFWRCILYLIVSGLVGFFLGRILPKRWFRFDRFPYRSYRFERDGRMYEKIRIKSWHQKLPDMSKIFPMMMPPKKVIIWNTDHLSTMLRETCVAELIHGLLCFSGLYCAVLWEGAGGKITAVLNIIGNLPFIMAQRYNRPRLIRLLTRTEKRRGLCAH